MWGSQSAPNRTSRASYQLARPRFSALLTAAFSGMALLLAAVGHYKRPRLLGQPTNPRSRRPIGYRRSAPQATQHKRSPRNDPGRHRTGNRAPCLSSCQPTARKPAVRGRDKRPRHLHRGPAVLATAAYLAAYLPAVRASRVDPIAVMREQMSPTDGLNRWHPTRRPPPSLGRRTNRATVAAPRRPRDPRWPHTTRANRAAQLGSCRCRRQRLLPRARPRAVWAPPRDHRRPRRRTLDRRTSNRPRCSSVCSDRRPEKSTHGVRPHPIGDRREVGICSRVKHRETT